MEDEFEGISFARKYRSSGLDEYIGNEDLKDSVRRYLKSPKRPQTILVEGPTGCGKTTISRILGMEYCCENRDPEKGACGECPTCKLFKEYIRTGISDDLPDVYEIDSSKSGTKNDIDSMLSSMEYPAISGYWKVYFIDEAHAMSDGAETRLLKSLEEPPEGVLIILGTTDPDKLLDTIKNRCQLKLQVTKPTTRELIGLLQRVCLNESKEYDTAGLRMIVTQANNIVRDSLNYLERVLNTRGNAKAESVSAEYKQVSDDIIFDFYNAYCNKDYVRYINVLYKIRTKYDFKQFLNTLTNFTTRGIYIINSVDVEGLSQQEIELYLKLFKQFKPQDISYILSQLKRMNLGDIEANLLAFMYCREENINQSSNNMKATQIEEDTVSLKDEKLLRNSNLQKLESAKLSRGEKSIQSEFESVSFSDVADLFSLEKVNQKEDIL